jgi:hypothetical protein
MSKVSDIFILLLHSEVKILDRKVVLGVPLDERVCPAKLGCTGSYRTQMYKEQTIKQTFFFIY